MIEKKRWNCFYSALNKSISARRLVALQVLTWRIRFRSVETWFERMLQRSHVVREPGQKARRCECQVRSNSTTVSSKRWNLQIITKDVGASCCRQTRRVPFQPVKTKTVLMTRYQIWSGTKFESTTCCPWVILHLLHRGVVVIRTSRLAKVHYSSCHFLRTSVHFE